ncbi:MULTISPECIES: hypothetical protein [unclassified Coleofasciculus]|uniref:hypothetical protein n=1 Tax=Cyanophyceae TaxID=3028117 RepID=UPI001689982E|nr:MULTISPECIES: hypothetical protein [unclassified Coleofasciculus]MBD1877726.1 hypothetical protein [Coleofasciculus sp. FACHB-T130]MBD2541308.1 hypothetical protein [Coleofasciculus sp. FACHB-SPT36]
MQLKDKEEQNSVNISSQLNLAIQAEKKTENKTTNSSTKSQLFLNRLSPEIKVLLVLLVFFGPVDLIGLMSLGALFALSISDNFDTLISDPCGEMQSEDTIQPR